MFVDQILGAYVLSSGSPPQIAAILLSRELGGSNAIAPLPTGPAAGFGTFQFQRFLQSGRNRSVYHFTHGGNRLREAE